MSIDTSGDQKQRPPVLKVQVVVSHQPGVLGCEPGSSGAEYTLINAKPFLSLSWKYLEESSNPAFPPPTSASVIVMILQLH